MYSSIHEPWEGKLCDGLWGKRVTLCFCHIRTLTKSFFFKISDFPLIEPNNSWYGSTGISKCYQVSFHLFQHIYIKLISLPSHLPPPPPSPQKQQNTARTCAHAHTHTHYYADQRHPPPPPKKTGKTWIKTTYKIWNNNRKYSYKLTSQSSNTGTLSYATTFTNMFSTGKKHNLDLDLPLKNRTTEKKKKQKGKTPHIPSPPCAPWGSWWGWWQR